MCIFKRKKENAYKVEKEFLNRYVEINPDIIEDCNTVELYRCYDSYNAVQYFDKNGIIVPTIIICLIKNKWFDFVLFEIKNKEEDHIYLCDELMVSLKTDDLINTNLYDMTTTNIRNEIINKNKQE
jgi:hypothetical protein